jgi:HEAT repeat protein
MKWMGRLFPSWDTEPYWLQPDAPLTRGELLERLLGGLRGPFAARSAERLRDVVDGIRMAERVRVDESVRRGLHTYDMHGTFAWLLGTPDTVRRLPLPRGTEGAVLGLLAAAPSGYVREAAVQRLALLGDGDEVPPLLIRAADWVLPVRSRAIDALRARLVPEYAQHWVRALPLVLRLRGTGRPEAWPLVDEVLALLHAPESRHAVGIGLHDSPERTVRRACFRILLDLGRPALGELVRLAQHNTDEVVRLEAARAAAALDDGALAELLPRMLADPYPRVRLVALGLAAERMGAPALPVLRAALLDRAAAIRTEARAAIARLESADLAEYYRERIDPDAPRLAEAVAGLAETGAAEDADFVAPLLAHARPRVRAAALRALVRLSGDAAVPALTAAVGDESPGVSRVAADALRPRAARVDGSALAAWFAAGHAPHVRRAALGLLATRGKWDGIAWILQACGDAEPTVQATGMQHLRRWHQRFNRSFTQPAPAQQERIRAALEHAGDAIDPAMAKWLRFVAGIG